MTCASASTAPIRSGSRSPAPACSRRCSAISRPSAGRRPLLLRLAPELEPRHGRAGQQRSAADRRHRRAGPRRPGDAPRGRSPASSPPRARPRCSSSRAGRASSRSRWRGRRPASGCCRRGLVGRTWLPAGLRWPPSRRSRRSGGRPSGRRRKRRGSSRAGRAGSGRCCATACSESFALLRARDPLVVGGCAGYLGFAIAALGASFQAFGGEGPPIAPFVLAYTLGQVGALIPTPGGLGGTEGGLIGMCVATGRPPRRPRRSSPIACSSSACRPSSG